MADIPFSDVTLSSDKRYISQGQGSLFYHVEPNTSAKAMAFFSTEEGEKTRSKFQPNYGADTEHTKFVKYKLWR